MNKYLLLALCSVLSLSLFASPRRVYPLAGETIAPKSYNFDLSVLYSVTASRYDVDGAEAPLTDSEAFTLIDTDLKISYGYSNKLELFLTGRYRQFTAENEVEQITSSGFESMGLGFKYAFKKKSKHYLYAISGEYSSTFYENDVYSESSKVPEGELALGDSGQSFGLNFHLSYIPSRWTTIEMVGGYYSPANDLSPELPYDLKAIKNFNKWAIWVGLRGIYSLGLDSYNDTPSEKPANATGGSLRWNSINRSYMQPYLGIRRLISGKYRASLEAGQIISGTYVDQSMDIIFNLAWTSGGVSKEEVFEKSFKEYTTEATVIKTSPRGKFLKIDKGMSQDIDKGARVDIYKTDFFGGNVLIATGTIYETGPSWAIVKIVKKFRSLPITKGFTARVK